MVVSYSSIIVYRASVPTQPQIYDKIAYDQFYWLCSLCIVFPYFILATVDNKLRNRRKGDLVRWPIRITSCVYAAKQHRHLLCGEDCLCLLTVVYQTIHSFISIMGLSQSKCTATYIAKARFIVLFSITFTTTFAPKVTAPITSMELFKSKWSIELKQRRENGWTVSFMEFNSEVAPSTSFALRSPPVLPALRSF